MNGLCRWLLPAVMLCICGCDKPEHPVVESAGPTPASIVDLRGVEVNPLATTNSPVALIFVRSDCPVSNRYAPEYRRLIERYNSRGVRFHLVYCDRSQQADTIRDHLKAYDLPDIALIDADHQLVQQAGATITPEAAVFDTQGRRVYLGRIDDRFVDFGQTRAKATRHDLRDAIDAVLAGQPVKVARTEAVGCYLADLP